MGTLETKDYRKELAVLDNKKKHVVYDKIHNKGTPVKKIDKDMTTTNHIDLFKKSCK